MNITTIEVSKAAAMLFVFLIFQFSYIHSEDSFTLSPGNFFR